MTANSATGGRHHQVSLFPLHTVLFPQGALPLKIFEARYIDMVGDCMRRKRPFGVIPIRHGSEVGSAPDIHDSGTLAVIESWDHGDDGLLHIVARGTERFRILDHSTGDDGLMRGTIETQTPPAGDSIVGFEYLCGLLEDLFNTRSDLAPARPWRLDSAAWTAYRFAELLPLSVAARLEILNFDDAQAKLARIARVIETQSEPDADTPKH